MCIPLYPSSKGPRNSKTPEATSISSTLVSKCYSPVEEIKPPCRTGSPKNKRMETVAKLKEFLMAKMEKAEEKDKFGL